jgi:hypothetical protein
LIEVIESGNGYVWRMICDAGRVLAYSLEQFPCVASAGEAAKAYRVAFWRIASQIDHRMGACR